MTNKHKIIMKKKKNIVNNFHKKKLKKINQRVIKV